MASDTQSAVTDPTTEYVRHFVGTHLGRKLKQFARDIFTNIKLVDLNVKQAYLLDFAVEDIEHLVSMINEMRTRRFIKNVLNVLQLGLDVVIIRPDTLQKLQSMDFVSKYSIVDVSKKRGSPEVMCKSSNIYKEMMEVFHGIHVNDKDITSIVVDCKICNITTMFGVLLGYPVVYWFDTENGQMENCLDMEPLESFKVMGQGHCRESDKREHCVYSFSVPQCVYRDLDLKVTQWFHDIRENCDWRCMFHDLTLTHTCVTLDAVVL